MKSPNIAVAWVWPKSTFGRRAVNDGKFVGRLRVGGRVTAETVARVQAFMQQEIPPKGLAPSRPRQMKASSGMAAQIATSGTESPPGARGGGAAADKPEKNFRFFDNRQKYLMFVNTCSESRWLFRPGVVGVGQCSSAAAGDENF